jgi:hypothetical protein
MSEFETSEATTSADSPSAPSLDEQFITAMQTARDGAQPQAEATTPDPAAAASGSETPTGQEAPETTDAEAMVPSFRLREETERRRQIEQQLEQIGPYTPLLNAIREQGLSPEQVQQALAQGFAPPQAQAQPTAEETFRNWAIETHGLDPYDTEAVDDREFRALQREHQVDQRAQSLLDRITQFEQAQQQAEQQAQAARVSQQFDATLATIKGQFSTFSDPVMGPEAEQYLRSSAWMMLQSNPQMTPADVLAKVPEMAQQFHERIEKLVSARNADYRDAKGRFAAVPSVAGGGAPAPVANPKNLHLAGPQEMDAALESSFLALNGSTNR